MKEAPLPRAASDKSASVPATNRNNCGLLTPAQGVPPACVPQRDCPPPAQDSMSRRSHSGLSTPARTSQCCWPSSHLLLYKKNTAEDGAITKGRCW